jgi:hypothetical protein
VKSFTFKMTPLVRINIRLVLSELVLGGVQLASICYSIVSLCQKHDKFRVAPGKFRLLCGTYFENHNLSYCVGACNSGIISWFSGLHAIGPASQFDSSRVNLPLHSILYETFMKPL